MLIDGRKLSKEILNEVSTQVTYLSKVPKIVIISVGNDFASKTYIKSKVKTAEKVGIECIIKKFSETVTELEVIEYIKELNSDHKINGIMVQLPLPKHINKIKILESISPIKDIDGFTSVNTGKLIQGIECLIPCTALGILHILDSLPINISGKNIVVIGRSDIVGKPIANLLLQKDATVTICHSKTINLKEYTKLADIIIVTIGKPNYIDSTFIKDGSIIIDVGINRVEDKENKKGYKIVGDVNFESVKDKVSYITPVPGGVGPLTVAMLMKNTIIATNFQLN